MQKKILIAPNAFKGSLSSIEAAKTIGLAVSSLNLGFKPILTPIADGGDNTLDVISYYLQGTKFISCKVRNPLMKKIKSKWLMVGRDTAIIELARASGINLLKTRELNPLKASTYGTGELILSAVKYGCKKIILTLGGSATVDAGIGILSALGFKFYDKNKNLLIPSGRTLELINSIDYKDVNSKIRRVKFYLLCDVENSLLGEKGVGMFAYQKGADHRTEKILLRGIKHYSRLVKKDIGVDYSKLKMMGAAGGVPFSIKSFFNAKLSSGFSFLSGLIELEKKIKDSGIIITGEGKLDRQTLMGKGLYRLAQIAKKHKKKVIVLCADYDSKICWPKNGIDYIVSIRPKKLSLKKSIKKVKHLIRKAIRSNVKLFANSHKNII